ncbi:MAG: bifunctional fucokinase/L-fucose-1-P-guanylyltransferase, partial [Lachnospiraceae bacterium]|nr:bifunctional fucokinase/L-fucose-1-P-guanylyltransferase [Lachnospiraceae bacterium]
FEQYVNERVRLNFYNDFVMPLASEVKWEEYRDSAPESGFSEELLKCREELWKRLSPYSIKLVRMSPAKYIHVGMTEELYDLMVHEIGEYEYLGWKKRILCNLGGQSDYSGINSYVGDEADISDSSYIENCVLTGRVKVSERTVLSGIYADFDIELPPEVVLHGLKLKDGRYVCRIYGIEDNPKGSVDSRYLGSSLRRLMQKTGLEASGLWDNMPPSIWNAKLYAVGSTEREALENAVLLYSILNGNASRKEIEAWKSSERMSLESSFMEANIRAFLRRQEEIRSRVRSENSIQAIASGADVYNVMQAFSEKDMEEMIFLKEYADRQRNLFVKIRLYLGLSYVCSRHGCTVAAVDAGGFEELVYGTVKEYIVRDAEQRYARTSGPCISRDEVIKKLPVRVNFCGSPSDAAPYCLEYGGTMLDGALLLKNELPICVEIKRLSELVIEFESVDLHRSVICREIAELQDCGNPYDTFSLHKAVLIAAGIVPYRESTESLEELCGRWGGGLKLVTSVNVPKGSGLGTSSILAACAVSAIYELFGLEADYDRIYSDVFVTEQLMNTGGGWQDQAGGLTQGLKYIHSRPGIYQKLQVEPVKLGEDIRQELQDRFALIFSGQRRLARNVLREEMNRCIRNHPESLKALEQIQRICVLMRFELERGNITEFAKYITEQFELVKTLDRGASNPCIEYIFDCCEDLIDGKAICGAGGGGFLQVILKKGVTKQQLTERIREHFEGCGAEVWDSTFFWEA